MGNKKLVYITSVNKHINILEDLPLREDNTTIECVETFKNALSATIDKLYQTIDFLPNEIDEKNLLINALIFSNANGGGKAGAELILSSNISVKEIETTLDTTNSEISSKSSNTSNYSLDDNSNTLNETSVINSTFINEERNVSITDNCANLNDDGESDVTDLNERININNSTIVLESLDDQLLKYKINNHNKYIHEKSMLSDLSNCIPRELTATINDVNLTTRLECTATNTIIDKQVLINRAVNARHAWPTNTVLIAGDSILNGIEEDRLKKNHSVKVRSFPGSNIDDM